MAVDTPDQPSPPSSSSPPLPADNPPQQLQYALNWNRSIHINQKIDDELVKSLTPAILNLKQESGKPITVGIDSFGGSIASLEALIGLLKAPDQDGNRCEIYTAVTNRAYSAAANMLALGDYAVAFPHAQILYHDLRYTGLDDVTPSKAARTAQQLEEDNDRFALKLAHHVARRFVWTYIDSRDSFDRIRKKYSVYVAEQEKTLCEIFPKDEESPIDIIAFALFLYEKLSHPADDEIAIGALQKLQRWIHIERIDKILPTLKNLQGNPVAIMDVINALDRRLSMEKGAPLDAGPSPETAIPELALSESVQAEFKLLIELVVRKAASDTNWNIGKSGLDSLAQDFRFIRDMNAETHVRSITNLLIRHDHTFFGRSIGEELKAAKGTEEKDRIMAPVFPHAKLFWHYVVLVCRALFEGDHLLTPQDGQLLGIVDEVLGGGVIESRREFIRRDVSGLSGENSDQPDPK
jgi:ATP-dependent protease ClpP protease subunit